MKSFMILNNGLRFYNLYFNKSKMERYFTTIALLGVDEGNLPVHRGMRQKRYESVEKMLDLLDVVKRIGPKFPL
jgi:hypothetical protein